MYCVVGWAALEVALHLFLAAIGDAPGFLLPAVEGDHDVVLFAPAQRVVHQMALRACPQAGGIPAQVFGKVLALHHGAVHHMPGHPGWVVDVLRPGD